MDKGCLCFELGTHCRSGGVPVTNVAFSQPLEEMGTCFLTSFLYSPNTERPCSGEFIFSHCTPQSQCWGCVTLAASFPTLLSATWLPGLYLWQCSLGEGCHWLRDMVGVHPGFRGVQRQHRFKQVRDASYTPDCTRYSLMSLDVNLYWASNYHSCFRLSVLRPPPFFLGYTPISRPHNKVSWPQLS